VKPGDAANTTTGPPGSKSGDQSGDPLPVDGDGAGHGAPKHLLGRRVQPGSSHGEWLRGRACSSPRPAAGATIQFGNFVGSIQCSAADHVLDRDCSMRRDPGPRMSTGTTSPSFEVECNQCTEVPGWPAITNASTGHGEPALSLGPLRDLHRGEKNLTQLDRTQLPQRQSAAPLGTWTECRAEPERPPASATAPTGAPYVLGVAYHY